VAELVGDVDPDRADRLGGEEVDLEAWIAAEDAVGGVRRGVVAVDEVRDEGRRAVEILVTLGAVNEWAASLRRPTR
jgi:hypothetical protein